jgi:hypothetical protein
MQRHTGTMTRRRGRNRHLALGSVVASVLLVVVLVPGALAPAAARPLEETGRVQREGNAYVPWGAPQNRVELQAMMRSARIQEDRENSTKYPVRHQMTYNPGVEDLAALRAQYHTMDGVEVASVGQDHAALRAQYHTTDGVETSTQIGQVADRDGAAPSQDLWAETFMALGLLLVVGGALVLFARKSIGPRTV